MKKFEFHDSYGKISVKEAKELFRKGKCVSFPNACWTDYNRVLRQLGFKRVKEIYTCSSAGDWTFAIQTKEGWRFVYQENRFPKLGFNYYLGTETFRTFKDMINYLTIMEG